MVKIAPPPKFSESDVGAVSSPVLRAIAARPSVNVAVEAQHMILDEHREKGLRDLQALSRQLRDQLKPLQEQLKSVDEMISVKHQELRNMKALSELSPEDFDDVVSGRATIMQDTVPAVAVDEGKPLVTENLPESQVLNNHDHTVQ